MWTVTPSELLEAQLEQLVGEDWLAFIITVELDDAHAGELVQ